MKTFHENLLLVSNGFDRAETLLSNTNNIQPNTTQYNKFIKYSKKIQCIQHKDGNVKVWYKLTVTNQELN